MNLLGNNINTDEVFSKIFPLSIYEAIRENPTVGPSGSKTIPIQMEIFRRGRQAQASFRFYDWAIWLNHEEFVEDPFLCQIPLYESLRENLPRAVQEKFISEAAANFIRIGAVLYLLMCVQAENAAELTDWIHDSIPRESNYGFRQFLLREHHTTLAEFEGQIVRYLTRWKLFMDPGLGRNSQKLMRELWAFYKYIWDRLMLGSWSSFYFGGFWAGHPSHGVRSFWPLDLQARLALLAHFPIEVQQGVVEVWFGGGRASAFRSPPSIGFYANPALAGQPIAPVVWSHLMDVLFQGKEEFTEGTLLPDPLLSEIYNLLFESDSRILHRYVLKEKNWAQLQPRSQNSFQRWVFLAPNQAPFRLPSQRKWFEIYLALLMSNANQLVRLLVGSARFNLPAFQRRWRFIWSNYSKTSLCQGKVSTQTLLSILLGQSFGPAAALPAAP